MDNVILEFWAKKSENQPGIHYPLLYHMIDSASVCKIIWEKVIQSGTRIFLSRQINLPENETGKWLSFWAGLHDIGKSIPAFQAKSDLCKEKLARAGFNFSWQNTDFHHGIATTCILLDLFKQKIDYDTGFKIALALGGHHGVFPSLSNLIPSSQLGNDLWQKQWENLYQCLAKCCGINDMKPIQAKPSHGFFMLVAGLISISDWIASNEAWFPYEVTHNNYIEHLDYADKKAELAIKELQWWWQCPPEIVNFSRCFDFTEIRPLQKEIISLTPQIKNRPGLVIIEAPMGEGKTEAALYLADTWLVSLKQKGCYFALPTQATSNQMFGRIRSFLEKRYANQTIGLMLLHGHSSLQSEFSSMIRRSNVNFRNVDIDGEKAYDSAPSAVVAAEWFTYRKRGLLAPFGVGTIDQALLSVLQTKYVFVRLFGLAGKTIIVDEVHAYDVYMITLLENLLAWLAATGSSVILLSATLPENRKNALIRAYYRGLNKKATDIPDTISITRYPRISWTDGSEIKAITIDTSSNSRKNIFVHWIKNNVQDLRNFELGLRLKQMLEEGGCVAVICNTVVRAQQYYLDLKEYFRDSNLKYKPAINLFHAHFVFEDRDKREKQVLVCFGKEDAVIDCGSEGLKRANRPQCAILVATQVIEQSLDIDFDLIITEMAPIDLILQRAGRLQRHKRNRPGNFQKNPPELWIIAPEIDSEGVPHFGEGTEAVYDYHILLRSWLTVADHLKQKDFINIPADVYDLIEKVYGDVNRAGELSGPLLRKWQESLESLLARRKKYQAEADQNSIPLPVYPDNILEYFNRGLEEDNPSLHTSLKALTRAGEDITLGVICLYGDRDKPFLDYEKQNLLDFSIPPDEKTIKSLLGRSISISHHGLVSTILRESLSVYENWRKHPLLRHYCLLFFNENRKSYLGNYEVKLDSELGLTIKKSAEAICKHII